MFSSLLYCAGQEMMRYSKLFSRILLRLLSEHKHKRTLKASTYKLISLCLEKCGYAFAESIYKPLVISVIDDLRVIEHKAGSIINTQNGQQKKSHKKRKTDVTNSDSLSSKIVSASSTEVQVAALDTLTSLMNVFGFAMENGQRSSADAIVLTRLIQVIQPSNMTDEEVILVKAGLYQSLIASVSHPIETQASILPHASRLFSAGINDQSHQLQTICKQGLTICDLITHSRLPPIQRALPKTGPTVVITAQEPEDEEELEDAEEEEVEEVVEKETKNVESKIFEKPVVKEQQKESVPITPVTLPPKITPVTLPTIEKPVVIEKPKEVVEDKKEETIVKETVVEKIVIEESTVEEKTVEVEPTKVPADISLPTLETTTAPAATAPIATTTTEDLSNTVVISEDEDMDMDMDMPMIDMTGPDSDEDDE